MRFCQLMTAKTTVVAVSNARAMAENRIMESFRIRGLPNLSVARLSLGASWVRFGLSNWDAMDFSVDETNKLLIYLRFTKL